MNLQKVRESPSLADTLNLLKAATRLMISQPAPGLIIGDKEKRMGIFLPEHERVPLTLTDAGRLPPREVDSCIGISDSILERRTFLTNEHLSSSRVGFVVKGRSLISAAVTKEAVEMAPGIITRLPDRKLRVKQINLQAELNQLMVSLKPLQRAMFDMPDVANLALFRVLFKSCMMRKYNPK